MASKTTHEVEVKVTDGGSTAKVNNEVTKLHKNLKDTQATAARPASQTASYVAAKAATDSGIKRGTTGAGGGSEAKDFSRQAQGLGGLVHVYATFAANIFAVSAAFTALSKAADYTNMVKGLDQLGASSGRNLTYLAKDLVKATDGAVSLKEAMTSVAQASAGGMDNTQIERLGTLSKKVSQALGRDVTDSLSRLTRGITKIEPELLDELGIFVRVDKAAADYARTIGKTATSLTDYERRQAFANAVLDQAQKKFGAIDLDANQYSKLQASFTNLLYSGGELLNKVLSPIIGILNSSPVALAGVMAAIAGTLLSKSIPALKGWREQIKAAADEASKISTGKVNAAILQKTAPERFAREEAERLANAEISYQDNIAKQLEAKKLREGLDLKGMRSSKDNNKFVKNLLEKSPADITDKELARLDKIAAASKNYKEQLGNLSDSLYHSRDLEIQASNAVEKHRLAVEAATKGTKGYSVAALNLAEAQQLQKKALGLGLVSSSVEKFSSLGWAAGITEFKEKLAAARTEMTQTGAKFNWLNTSILGLRTGIGFGLSYLSKFIGAFGYVGMAIAALTGAFQLLDSWLTSSAKEQAKFSESMEKASSSVDTLNNTLKLIEDKDPLERLSIDSILAKANALKGAANSIKELITSFNEVKSAQSGWDISIDWISQLWGGSTSQKATAQVSKNIVAAMKALPDTKEAKNAREQIQGILGTADVTNGTKVKSAVTVDNMEQLSEILNKLGDKSARELNNLKSAFDGLNEASKSFDTLVNGLASSDPFSKMAATSAKAFSDIIKQLGTAENQVAAFKEISKDLNKLRLLPENAAMQIINLTPELEKYTKALEATKTVQGWAQEDLIKAQQEYNSIISTPEEYGSGEDRDAASNKVTEAQILLSKLDSKTVSITAKIAETSGTIVEAFKEGALVAIERLSQGVSIAFEKAQIEVSKAVLSGLTSEEAIRRSGELQKQEIDLGLKQLNATVNLLVSQERLRLVMEAIVLKNAPGKLGEQLREDNEAAQGLFFSAKDNKELFQKIQIAAKGGNNNFTTLNSALQGITEKRIEADAKKEVVNLNTDIAVINSKAKASEDLLKNQVKLNAEKQKEVDLNIKLANIYNPVLAKVKEDLELERESLELRELELGYMKKIRELGRKMASAKTPEDAVGIQTSAIGGLGSIQAEYQRELDAKKLANKNAAEARDVANTQQQAAEEKHKREEADKYLDLQLRINSVLEDTGTLSKSEASALKFKVEQTKRLVQYAEETKSLQDSIDVIVKKGGILSAIDEATIISLNAQISAKQHLQKDTEATIVAEQAYTQTLQTNTDLLVKMERKGEYGKEYFGALVEDFNNKLGQMIKAAKSAADVFNSGLIGAIDASIDKFFDLMMRSELTLSAMVLQIRNSLAEAFRDAASQTIKNYWKDTIKGVLGESKAEEAARVAVEDAKKARDSIAANTLETAKNTSAMLEKLEDSKKVEKDKYGIDKSSPHSKQLAEQDAAFKDKYGIDEDTTQSKMLAEQDSWFKDNESIVAEEKKNVKAQEDATKYFGSSVNTLSGTFKQLGSDFDRLLKSQQSVGDLLINFIKGLGSTIASSISGITSIFNGTAGSSAGGSILGNIGNLFKGGSDFIGSLFSSGPAAISTPSSLFEEIFSLGGSVGGLMEGGLLEEMFMLGVLKKGGAFQGSPGLSAYSNSIVSSPTTFAFAKGGMPTHGLMGEAGPEAIIPLKRDATGTLGVRGGAGSINNVEIVINIENGSVNTNTTGGVENTASQLGNIIKGVVAQELINQTRPGGLLAR